MDRSTAYIVAAPVVATYMLATSSREALRHAYMDLADVTGRYAHELLRASLVPNPEHILVNDRDEVVRALGYAILQESQGVPRSEVVNGYLSSVKSIAQSRLDAAARRFEGVYMSMGSVMLIPILLLSVWSYGIIDVGVEAIMAIVVGSQTLLGLAMWALMPRDFNPVKLYGPALPIAASLGAATAAAMYIIDGPLGTSMLAFGLALTAYLIATGRIGWFRASEQIPAFLKAVSGRLREGIPIDVAVREISAQMDAARMIVYGYRIPSMLFALGRSIYRALSFAGPALVAAEFVQWLVEHIGGTIRRVKSLALAYSALFIAVSTVVVWSLSTSLHKLYSRVSDLGVPWIGMRDFWEVGDVVSQVLSLAAGMYVATVLVPGRGVWFGATVGGLASLAMRYAYLAIWGFST